MNCVRSVDGEEAERNARIFLVAPWVRRMTMMAAILATTGDGVHDLPLFGKGAGMGW